MGLGLQPKILLDTHLSEYRLFARGKVRDVYEDDLHKGSRLLIVATDRISAFDFILATGIPDKGRVLTQMTLFWLDFLRDVVPNHFLSSDTSALPPEYAGRSMWVRRAEMFPVECVARGYLAGSGWKDYQRSGELCGIRLPPGLRESDALPEPLFTPATKAQSGHDENISFDQAAALVGHSTAIKLRDLTLDLYRKAAEYARTRGIIIADTKFEFGVAEGQIVLADEVLTPDSSRFWPADQYQPGRSATLTTTSSNTCGIISNPSTGTSSLPRRLCLKMSPAAPARNIRKPITRSLDRELELR